MTKLLQKHGNSVSLVFDKSMLDAMNVTPETPLQVTIHSGIMTIAPVNVGIPQDELEERIARLRPKYKKMLENLAK